MNYMHKTYYFLRKEGFYNTSLRILKRIWHELLHLPGKAWEHIFCNQYRRKIAEKVEKKKVFIFFSCFEWNMPLYQRPHQIAAALARLQNTYVLFVSDEYRYDNFAGILHVNPQLDVISRRIIPCLQGLFNHAESVVAFKCWPMQRELLDYICYNRLVYEYIDDISILPYYTNETIQVHRELIKQADLTVCTSEALFNDALPWAKKAILCPNAGDYAFFHGMRGCKTPYTLTKRIRKYSCVLGYYGGIADWLDYDLICKVAQMRPDWCFLLIGNAIDQSVKKLRRKKLDNIILYPAQNYQKLPHFVSAFDIQIIPFQINTITTAVSPVKLFEYMASGKPILAAAMPECMRYRSVCIYQNVEDFIIQAKRLKELSHDPDYLSLLDKEARENTWDARVKTILEHINVEAKLWKEE